MMMVMVMLMMMRGDDNVDIEEEEEDAVEEDDVEEEDRSQDQQAHLARACAAKMRIDMTRAILIGNLQGKRRTCACEPAQSKCAWTFHKSHFFTRAILYSNLQGKCRTQSPRPVLCEPAQSKCTWAFHKSHLVQKFTGKMPTSLPRPTFCVSLRSWHVHGHVTRGILWGNLQEKCQTNPIPPRLNTGPWLLQ